MLRCTNLVSGAFSTVVSNLPPAAPMNVYTDNFVGAPVYYRVGVRLP